MIEFKHKLPSMHIDGKTNGTYNNYEMVLPCVLTTTDTRLGEFLHGLHNVIEDDRSLVFIDGRVLAVCKNWIRDHVHVMKGFKHWEYDIRSFLDFIIETQREDGCYYELIKQMDDLHWQFVDEDCRVLYPDDNVALVRLELEADIEYLVVEGAMQVYRATGDFDWLLRVLPNLERGIAYITSDKKRWSSEYGLVIRPHTIDTWDFVDTPTSGTDRRIHEKEPMSIMHGDNSGVYQAMCQLAWINEKAGNPEKAAMWLSRAETLRNNMIRHLWNGRFFVHQKPINHDGIDGKEDIRLSLSNSYDMNRGVTTHAQSCAIIEEYLSRRETTSAFAEWFSIDPPYEPSFHKHSAGTYVNGGISPFTAGELARAAFENGYEDYAWDILCRFNALMERDGTVYFLYSTDGQRALGGGPSAWGAAAFMNAVDEGLAGIVDCDSLYREIRFSPRFPVTHYKELRYITGYECSHTFVDVRWTLSEEGMRYDLYAKEAVIHAHILLPKGKSCSAVIVDGQPAEFTLERIRDSVYVNFEAEGKRQIIMELYFSSEPYGG